MHFRLQIPFADDDQITRFFRSDFERNRRLEGLQAVADEAVVNARDLNEFTHDLVDRLFTTSYKRSHHAGDDR